MSHIRRNALMPYTPAQMYSVVNDVAAYPTFLPWCRASEVLLETETEMLARIELGKGPVHKNFTTRNQLKAPGAISIRLEEGPFEMISGEWTFSPLGDAGCRVDMDLTFELKGGLGEKALGVVLSQIANNLVDAFCDRADELYD